MTERTIATIPFRFAAPPEQPLFDGFEAEDYCHDCGWNPCQCNVDDFSWEDSDE